MEIKVVKNVLAANDRLAGENRAIFDKHGLRVVNIMSSPGAGKTTLLEASIERLKGRLRIGVIEGDIQSSRDAERIARHGAPAVQINTEGACHLDAGMVRQALEGLDLAALDLLIIENVGNLVCPAEFNLGEDLKMMLLSVTEGDDKPLKYPLMFQLSRALVVNKIDLLPHVDCSVETIRQTALGLNPQVEIFELSARTGEGMEAWCDWLAGLAGR